MKDCLFIVSLWFIEAAFLLGIKSELVANSECAYYVFSAFIYFLVGFFLLILSSKMKRE